MRQRCYNKNRPNFKYYGGRGISVCKDWNSFAGFCKDMESDYKPGLTLDRIDNNGNYCKENCRWVTMSVQNNNKSWNKNITYKGITRNINQWAKHLEMNRITLWSRLYKSKWSIERSFTEKVRIWP